MRKPRNLSAVLSTAPIPLGLAVGSYFLFDLAAGLGLVGGLLAGAAGLVLAAYAVMSGAAIVSLSLAPKSHKGRAPVTIQRDEATGEWVASVPASPAREARGPTPEAAGEALCAEAARDFAQPPSTA